MVGQVGQYQQPLSTTFQPGGSQQQVQRQPDDSKQEKFSVGKNDAPAPKQKSAGGGQQVAAQDNQKTESRTQGRTRGSLVDVTV